MSASNRPRLLSVEDNPETRLVLKHLLNPSYEIHFARDAEEGLRAIEKGEFDALLIDINLGDGTGGTELLRRAREDNLADGAPAIAVTAYAMPGDRETFLEKGFDGYVGKPFTGEALREAIGRALPGTT